MHAKRFRHAALVGKPTGPGHPPGAGGDRAFPGRQGLEVTLERDTAQATGVTTSTR
jgi:hypothetical protein